MKTIDELCELAHDTYRIAAQAHGLTTHVAWDDLSSKDKATMRAMMIVLHDEIIRECEG